jgi:hypothetical protein
MHDPGSLSPQQLQDRPRQVDGIGRTRPLVDHHLQRVAGPRLLQDRLHEAPLPHARPPDAVDTARAHDQRIRRIGPHEMLARKFARAINRARRRQIILPVGTIRLARQGIGNVAREHIVGADMHQPRTHL